MSKTDFLFILVRAELWGEELELKEFPSRPFKQISELAEQQTLTGLVYSALLNNNVKLGKYDVAELYQTLRSIEDSNKKLDKELGLIAAVFNQHGVNYQVVKGQVVAPFYPHPKTRVSGDIDVYICNEDLDKATALFYESFGLNMPQFGKGKHISITHNDITIELHRRLNDFYSSAHQRYWNRIFDESFSETYEEIVYGKKVRTLNPTLNILYVFTHLYYHMLGIGVGLRQFVDLAILLHRFNGQIDKNQLTAHLHQLGLYNAFCAIGYILIDKIGLRADVFPFEIDEWHKKYEERILDEVFLRGNFGHYYQYSNRPGWKHTIETAYIFGKHCCKLFRLSPREIVLLFPKTIADRVQGKMVED